MKNKISTAASLMGRKGGSSKSEEKRAAARANGAKGGRPKSVVTFNLIFASGYETEVRISRETAMESEYWVEFTERQNPYDAQDDPLYVDGISMTRNNDWMLYVDDKLCVELKLAQSDLYK